MTLCIAVRLSDGTLILTDQRSTIRNSEGKVTGTNENFQKTVHLPSWSIYHYGYNRIDNCDWKFKAESLLPDPNLPIYRKISREILRKRGQKCSCFMFISDDLFSEIIVNKGKTPILKTFGSSWWVKAGDGEVFVEPKDLNTLKGMKCSEAMTPLLTIFHESYERQISAGKSSFNNLISLKVRERRKNA